MAKRDHRSKRVRHLASALLVIGSLGLPACNKAAAPSVELEVGPQRYRFAPHTAFAEYWELPGEPDQLRVSLASYSASCETYRGPGKGEALVTLTLRVPPGKSLAPGEYRWKGLEETPDQVSEPSVIPFVRLADEGRALSAGGALWLTHFDKSPHGLVEGRFAFSTPEAATPEGTQPAAPSSGLRGAFTLRLCRVSLDASRKGLEPSVLRP